MTETPLLDKDQSLSRTRTPHAVGEDELIYIEEERPKEMSKSMILWERWTAKIIEWQGSVMWRSHA
jgi:hypothetical protein